MSVSQKKFSEKLIWGDIFTYLWHISLFPFLSECHENKTIIQLCPRLMINGFQWNILYINL